jgi:hypothetical protein
MQLRRITEVAFSLLGGANGTHAWASIAVREVVDLRWKQIGLDATGLDTTGITASIEA